MTMTAMPTLGLARTLHRGFREALRDGMLRMLGSVQAAVPGADLQPLLNLASDLDASKRFDPNCYAAYWKLARALESREPNEIRTELRDVAHALSAPYVAPGLVLNTLDLQRLADRQIKIYVEGPEGPADREGNRALMEAMPRARAAVQHERMRSALALIEEHDPEVYSEFEEYVSSSAVFQGRIARGITSVRAFGRVYLREPDSDEAGRQESVAYYVSHLVHETSHLHLHTMMLSDPMVLNPDSERFEAPIRWDPRPIYGIYHASFVLSRMLRVFRRWSARDDSSVVRSHLTQYEGMFEKGQRVLGANATMTDAGRELFESLGHTAAS